MNKLTGFQMLFVEGTAFQIALILGCIISPVLCIVFHHRAVAQVIAAYPEERDVNTFFHLWATPGMIGIGASAILYCLCFPLGYYAFDFDWPVFLSNAKTGYAQTFSALWRFLASSGIPLAVLAVFHRLLSRVKNWQPIGG